MSAVEGSVVVPTYNRADIISGVIRCLMDQDCLFPYEILIMDDGSTDRTSEIVSCLQQEMKGKKDGSLKEIKYLRFSKKGASHARNQGVKNSAGRIIFFVDSDVFVRKNFLRAHYEYHKKYGNILVQGPVIRTYDPVDPFVAKRNFLTDSSFAFFDTCNASIAKEHIEKAGFFDEGFALYGWEDLELGLRLRKNGIFLKRNILAKAYHLQTAFSLRDFGVRENKEKSRALGAVLFYSKKPDIEVKLMTQNIPVFFILERILSGFAGLVPGKKMFLGFIEKRFKGSLYPALVDLYFFLRYLRYLSEAGNKMAK